MKKSEWSDKQLEEYLRQMPKIQDHRHPRDIYQNLSIKRRKRPNWLVPSIAAAAAVILLFILVPNFLGGSANQSAEDKASMENKAADIADRSSLKMKENRSFSSDATPEGISAAVMKTAVYEEDAVNAKVLTYWIPDHKAKFLIPVSTMYYGAVDKDWVSLFNENMSVLQEENWGLSEYYPMNASIMTDNENNVIVDVPANHHYGDGATNETVFLNALENDISTNSLVKAIKFTTNGQPGIELGNTGNIKELAVKNFKHHAYLLYNPKGSTVPFLVPTIIQYNDVQSALDAMKKDDGDLDLKASLLPISIKEASMKEKTLYITLDGKKELVNDQDTIVAFESILLTAKEFDAEFVLIKNPALNNLGPFDLTQKVKVPIAPNLR